MKEVLFFHQGTSEDQSLEESDVMSNHGIKSAGIIYRILRQGIILEAPSELDEIFWGGKEVKDFPRDRLMSWSKQNFLCARLT